MMGAVSTSETSVSISMFTRLIPEDRHLRTYVRNNNLWEELRRPLPFRCLHLNRVRPIGCKPKLIQSSYSLRRLRHPVNGNCQARRKKPVEQNYKIMPLKNAVTSYTFNLHFLLQQWRHCQWGVALFTIVAQKCGIRFCLIAFTELSLNYCLALKSNRTQLFLHVLFPYQFTEKGLRPLRCVH
jgi:hypothetical protein